MKNNKKFRTLSCLVAGCLLLTGAVFANIDNANGYTNYKNALKKLVKSDNYTADVSMKIYMDDTIITDGKVSAKVENGRTINYEVSAKMIDDVNYKTAELVEESGNSYYNDKDVSVHCYDLSDSPSNSVSYQIEINNSYDENDYEGKKYYPLIGTGIDENVVDKAIMFGETVADGFIGDVKNNFVYLGEENGERHYSVSLAKEQMPSIITSGLSLVSGVMQSSLDGYEEYSRPGENEKDYNNLEDVIAMMFLNKKEPFIKSAVCDFAVDSNGNLTHNFISGVLGGYTLDGTEHTLKLEINADIRDIGSTVSDKLDIYGFVGNVVMQNGTSVSFEELCGKALSIYAISDGNRILVDNYNINEEDMPFNTIFIVNGKEVTNNEYNEAFRKLLPVIDVEAGEEYTETKNGETVSLEVAEDSEYSFGVIGGADGPTAIYVTD